MLLTLFSNRSKLRLSRKKLKKSHKKVKKNRNNLFVFRLQFFPPHCFCFSTKTITLHVKVSEKVTTPKKEEKKKEKKLRQKVFNSIRSLCIPPNDVTPNNTGSI
jgi:hypothetical protein